MTDFPYSEVIPQAMEIARAVTYKMVPRTQSYFDVEAIESEARRAALIALRRYQPDRNTTLTTWIFHSVRFAVRQEMREQDFLTRQRRKAVRDLWLVGGEESEMEKPPLSLDEPILGPGNETLLLGEQVPDPSRSVEESVLGDLQREWLFHLIEELPVRQRQILIFKYWDGMTRPAIAKQLGLTRQEELTQELRAERRLKALLEREGIDASLC